MRIYCQIIEVLMPLKNGFLLLESLISFTFLLLIVTTVAYYQATVVRWQQQAIQRLRATSVAREILATSIQNSAFICPAEKDGFTVLVKKHSINIPSMTIATIDASSTPIEHSYYYTGIRVTVSWQLEDTMHKSVTLYSGLWHS